MSHCVIDMQSGPVAKLVCAWMIQNDPVSFMDVWSVSIPIVAVVWLASLFFTSPILKVFVRSLALAFLLCGDPMPLPFFYPLFVPVLLPDWPYLFVRNVHEGPEYYSRLTFIWIFLVASIVLGFIEWRHKLQTGHKI